MDMKKTIILSGFAIAMMVTTGGIVFAEDTAVAPVDQTVVTSDQQPVLSKENDMQWAWGEVTNLDNQTNAITLKYLDYETDQEKDLVLVVDEKTTFENVKDFSELKLKDTLSIDYIVGADNKNIAKNISFEKPDVSSSVPAPEAVNEATPVVAPVVPVVESAPVEVVPAVEPVPVVPAVEPAPVQGQAQ